MVGAWGQTPGTSGSKRPMTFADLQAMKRVSDPQISPSGKWVMFSVTDVSLEKNTKVNHLWVVPLPTAAQRTTGSRREMGDAFFAEMRLKHSRGKQGASGDVRRWGVEWTILTGREMGVVFDEGPGVPGSVE